MKTHLYLYRGKPMWTACLLVLLGTAGCETLKPRAEPLPDVEPRQLIERYNARAAGVRQVWSRATLQLKWTDTKGKKHSEKGDGHVILRKPDEVAIMVGTKIGDPWVVLGGNETRFWFFDLKPVKGQPTAVYFGNHNDLDDGSMADLSIPVRPDLFIHLLGVHELPWASGVAPQPTPDRKNGGYWYQFPVESSGEQAVQHVLIDPATALPKAIRFVGESGRTIAEAWITRFEQVHVKDRSPTDWPQVATRIEVHSPANKTRLTLHLSDPTTDKVTDAQFNIEALRKRYKPDKVLMLRPRQ